MGRSLLIILFGFAASFGILAYSKDRRMLDSVDRVVNRVDDYSTKNTATSGAYMVLNKLFQNPAWRTGYSDLVLGNDSLGVVVKDNSMDASIKPHYIRIISKSRGTGDNDSTRVTVFDATVNQFAVWAKDSVHNVSTNDSLNNSNPSLKIAPAPFMPEIDKVALVDEATNQGNVQSGSSFHPPSNYPNGSFYDAGVTPNVTHVLGDLYVHNGTTIYGIYIVEGNVYFDPDGALFGVLYLPNASSSVNHQGGGVDIGRIRGGVITWGTMDGGNNIIRVRHWPSYLSAFFSNYVPRNPQMRVIAWE